MRFKNLMMMLFISVLISGCANEIISNSYCDIAKPHLFGSSDTVAWLLKNDRQLFLDTVIHNEQLEKICIKKK